MSGGGEAGLDLEMCASTRWQRALGGDAAAGDEERARMARLCGRRDETARDGTQAREPLELAAHLLERLQPVSEPRGVFVAAVVSELGEPLPHAGQSQRRPFELARLQRASRELRASARPDRA